MKAKTKAATSLVRISQEQLARLRARKAETGATLRHLVEKALEQFLAQPGK